MIFVYSNTTVFEYRSKDIRLTFVEYFNRRTFRIGTRIEKSSRQVVPALSAYASSASFGLFDAANIDSRSRQQWVQANANFSFPATIRRMEPNTRAAASWHSRPWLSFSGKHRELSGPVGLTMAEVANGRKINGLPALPLIG